MKRINSSFSPFFRSNIKSWSFHTEVDYRLMVTRIFRSFSKNNFKKLSTYLLIIKRVHSFYGIYYYRFFFFRSNRQTREESAQFSYSKMSLTAIMSEHGWIYRMRLLVQCITWYFVWDYWGRESKSGKKFVFKKSE